MQRRRIVNSSSLQQAQHCRCMDNPEDSSRTALAAKAAQRIQVALEHSSAALQ